MKEMVTVNLKEHQPAADDAICMLDMELSVLAKSGVKVVKVVHGYGSHGTGGLIFLKMKQYFVKEKKNSKVKDVIFGSDWNIANKKVFDLCLQVSDCADDSDLKFCNPGITIVVLK